MTVTNAVHTKRSSVSCGRWTCPIRNKKNYTGVWCSTSWAGTMTTIARTSLSWWINKGSGNCLLHTTSATHTHRAANGRTVTNCHSMANKTISRWKICKKWERTWVSGNTNRLSKGTGNRIALAWNSQGLRGQTGTRWFYRKNLLLFGKQPHTIQMPNIVNEQEQTFIKAMRDDDFNTILELKMKGYQPSDNVLKSLQPDISSTTFIAAAKIFQMERMLKSIQDIKPAQSPIIDGNKRSMELGG